MTVRANVSGATKVEFFLDGVRRSTDSATPFAWTWNSAASINGSHSVTAKGYNGATLLGTSAATTVTVNNSAPPTCSDDLSEPNDSSLTAIPLAFGVPTNGFICTATDVDWFRVDVTTPEVITFDLSVPAGNDYDMELFGPNATYLTGSYRDAALAERIAHNATVTGTYWVRVYGYPVGNGSRNPDVPFTLIANEVSGPVTIIVPPQPVTVPAGTNFLLSVTAAGMPPLDYRWQTRRISWQTNAGPWTTVATGQTFVTQGLLRYNATDFGVSFRVEIRVLITNPAGSVDSGPINITVIPAPPGTLHIRDRMPWGFDLVWNSSAVLQQGPTISGPWTDIFPVATPPYLVDQWDPAYRPSRFFRLRSPNF